MSEEIPEELVGAVEALLFASGDPISVKDLAMALVGTLPAEVESALMVLGRRFANPASGVRLVEVSGGWQIRTDPRFADAVLRLRGARPQKLSRASIEVLAVVAWRQPVIKSEIDQLRGVDSGGVLKSLIDRGLIRGSGRREDIPGRPLEYSTTPAFLEMFQLRSLRDLPSLRERQELAASRPGADEGS
jgi:segregation and condensation protein B